MVECIHRGLLAVAEGWALFYENIKVTYQILPQAAMLK